MMTVVHSHHVLVHAPLQSAFDYIADLSKHPEWSDGQLTIEAVTPGPIAVGKEYTSRGQFLFQKERLNQVRVTGYEPPFYFAFVAQDPGVGAVTHEFRFAQQNEQVHITRTMRVSLPLLLALPFRFLVYPLIGRPSMERSLALLKRRLEVEKQLFAVRN